MQLSASQLTLPGALPGPQDPQPFFRVPVQDLEVPQNGTFRPEGRITRQQLAAILFRYTEYRGADTAGRTDLSRFSDSAAVADYAREALAWAVSAGLLQGRSDGTLNPSGSATRAQTAVILQRLETLLEKN